MPRVYVIPSWAVVVVFSFVGFAIAKWVIAASEASHAQRSLVSCEARAQATLVKATQCDAHLTSCLGSVSRIAEELELSEAVIR